MFTFPTWKYALYTIFPFSPRPIRQIMKYWYVIISSPPWTFVNQFMYFFFVSCHYPKACDVSNMISVLNQYTIILNHILTTVILLSLLRAVCHIWLKIDACHQYNNKRFYFHDVSDEKVNIVWLYWCTHIEGIHSVHRVPRIYTLSALLLGSITR